MMEYVPEKRFKRVNVLRSFVQRIQQSMKNRFSRNADKGNVGWSSESDELVDTEVVCRAGNPCLCCEECQPSTSSWVVETERPSRLRRVLGLPVKMLQRIWALAFQAVRPQGPGSNDRSLLERCLNVMTSFHFIWLGGHTMRSRITAVGRQFGRSFIVVGVVASLYHAAGGPLRPHLRRLDYWTISWSSSCLRRAGGLTLNPLVERAVLVLVPFTPTLVTFLNMSQVEVLYALAAVKDKKLLRSWLVHALSSGSALTCFGLEDHALDHGFDFLHCLWHCLAAMGIGTTNALLQYHEEGLQREVRCTR